MAPHDATSRAVVLAQRESSTGPIAENVHRLHIAISRPDGSLLASAGDPHRQTLTRSAAKPFQALALLVHGLTLPDDALALACASHKGAPWQLEVIRAWLDREALPTSLLACGAHTPADVGEANRLRRQGLEPEPLHHNCSGKHAGMLALAKTLGADLRHYLRADQPTQRAVRACVEAVAGGGRPPRLAWAVDGCSAPTPAMPLSRLSASYARLAAAGAAQDPFGALPVHSDSPSAEAMTAGLARIFHAMREHAELVAGPGLLDTALMRAILQLVAKRGADGVYGMALAASPHGPIGIALKVEDGSNEARDPAVIALLETLGVLNPASRVALAPFTRPRRLNARGLVVGHLEASVELQWTP